MCCRPGWKNSPEARLCPIRLSTQVIQASFFSLKANFNNDRAVQANSFGPSIKPPPQERTEKAEPPRHASENGKGRESEKEKPALLKDYLKH